MSIQMSSEPKSKHTETILLSDRSETSTISPRLAPLIRQRASLYESPQERSRAVTATFADEQENDALIEISDDSDNDEDEITSRPIASHHRSPRKSSMSSSIKSRISIFESPRRSFPQKSSSNSPSKGGNGLIQTKARLFEMMRSGIKSPGKFISKRRGSKKRSNQEKSVAPEIIDVEEKVRDVDELFDLYQEKTGKSPRLFGSLREKVKKSHRAHFLQKANEQKKEMTAKAYAEGLEKDKLERNRVTIQVPNEDDETDNEETLVKPYTPSITAAGLPFEQLSRRRSVARSVHVAVDLPEDYMQSKKHAQLIAACQQEYRCQSLGLPMDTEFPATYSETVRKETLSKTSSVVKPLKAPAPKKNWLGSHQSQLHKRLSNVVVVEGEKPAARNRYVRPQGLHFDWSLPPADFNANVSNETKFSEWESEDAQDDLFPKFNLPDRDEIMVKAKVEEGAVFSHDGLPTLRRLPSIRRLPTPSTSASTSSSSDSKTSLVSKQSECENSKKEGDEVSVKSKKEKKDKKRAKEEKAEKKERKEKKSPSKDAKVKLIKVKLVKSKSSSSKSLSKDETEEKVKLIQSKSGSSKSSSKGEKDGKEKPVKSKNSSSKSSSSKKSKKDKKKKTKNEEDEEKTQLKNTTMSFADTPVADFEMATMVRKLQDAREAARNIIDSVNDALPRKPQRRPSLASCSDVGLELCHQLRSREAHLFG